MTKPHLSKSAIWNMSVGFLGIQMGFALQNSNASRILQTFGADTHSLGWFWLVAPITGMLVQPIIGAMSDARWSDKWGRRKPFFLIGAILASLGLIFMPNAGALSAFIPALWIGAGMLMVMDASFNIAMEPFRALVADKLPSEQRTEGFAAQTTLIGIGAVLGSWLPYFLIKVLGIGKDTPDNLVPNNVIISFVIGAAVLILSILWTMRTTSEYSPTELKGFGEATDEDHKSTDFWTDLKSMPKTMAQLGLVQFFSWFALFGMWVYTTPAIAHHVVGLPLSDTKSSLYQECGDWTGVIFGVYNAASAIFAFFLLPYLSKNIGRKRTHMWSLVVGGICLVSMYFAPSLNFLIIPMIGLGLAWASILAMPYSILAGSIPVKKMGVYMGIFNLFITIPQIVSGLFAGVILTQLFDGQAIYVIVMSGVSMILAGILTLQVEDKDDPVHQTKP
jgi:maltose/moltooligosaccharide transporter